MADSTKIRLQRLKCLIFVSTCVGIFTFSGQTPVHANVVSDLVNRVRDFFDPPRPSDRPPTGNRVSGGGARPGSCLTQYPVLPMVALLPQEDLEMLTISEQPILWFYSPYSDQLLQPWRSLSLVLSLKDNVAAEEVYKNTFPFEASEGISHIQLPLPIEVGKTYEWDVNIICTNQPLPGGIEGSIKRVEPNEDLRECLAEIVKGSVTSEKVQAIECYAQADLWYDSLTGIAELSCETNFTIDWLPLLTQNDVELDDALEDFEDDVGFINDIDDDDVLDIIANAPLASFCDTN